MGGLAASCKGDHPSSSKLICQEPRRTVPKGDPEERSVAAEAPDTSLPPDNLAKLLTTHDVSIMLTM